MNKKILAFLLAALLCIISPACFLFDEEDENENQNDETFFEEHNGDPNQTWAVYWYLCGSDLETECAAATEDLIELTEVTLPENVKFVIETGGTQEWQNDMVDSQSIERYVYSSDDLELVDSLPPDNMGDPDTLADFLYFCKKNYPADKTMVLFWNHGGGSVAGAAFDENYDYDSLTLSEFHRAFDAVYDLSENKPPFEAIGFDACLMATIDTAYTFSDIAKYMIASEESEPGCGWNYTGWAQALADNPGMDGALLGKSICDSYISGCEEYYVDYESTLSVTDLTKINPLLDAYEAMGREALNKALDDPTFLCELEREAVISENYGGNSRSEGYTNMVDLGDWAENCSQILPKSFQKVVKELKNCVVYKVNGFSREYANGLSCYYLYHVDKDDFEGFKDISCSDSFKYLYTYAIEDDLPQEALDYVNQFGYDSDNIPDIPELDTESEEVYPIYLDDAGYAILELDEETTGKLSGVYFQLTYMDEENDIMLLLGRDNDIVADWDNGIFKDNFRGVWGSIDGHFVYMELTGESEDYNRYSVPILLNGEAYNLQVDYNFNKDEFLIYGARKGIDDNGMADKNLVKLKPGDEITTLHYAASISGDDDFEFYEVETFTVNENTSFYEQDLGDGEYIMMFELKDFMKNTVYSQAVQFSVDGEDIYTEIIE